MSTNKIKSSEAFWSRITDMYGDVPELIKLVLQINGFNTFLALKGIRYDDKNEFFASLEMTVLETMNSNFDLNLKEQLENEMLAQYQNAVDFKLKPGHRNYIMNLMLEIDRVDVDDFFGRTNIASSVTPTKESPMQTQSNARRANDTIYIKSERAEHGYSNSQTDEAEDNDFIFEEEYLIEDSIDTLGLIKYEYEDESSFQALPKSKPRTSSSSTSATKRKPDHMYNDEFLSTCINPRRRRVMINKSYPDTDDGTRERFSDLIQQSMQCILPRERLTEVEDAPIEIEKESEASWAVYCPLCHTRVRLAVVRENNGRYCNYKRSNFERHLRFKHCKQPKCDSVEVEEETIEEILC